MAPFKFTVEVTAENKQQAIEKLEAFNRIISTMEHKDFVDTANYIADHPEAVVKIKGWIENPPWWAKTIMSEVK